MTTCARCHAMLDTSLRDSAAPQRIVVCEPRRMRMWRRRVVRVWEEAGGDGEEEANVNVEDGEEGWSGGAGYMELGGRAAARIRRRWRRCLRARRRRARMGRMREGGVASA